MAKVTISVKTENTKHTVERSTPPGQRENRTDTARLLLAAMLDACAPYKAEITDETEPFRQFMIALGFMTEAPGER